MCRNYVKLCEFENAKIKNMKYKKWIIGIITASLLIALLVYKVIYVNPHNIVIREETIKSPKLNSKDDELIVAYFSDTHLANYTTIDDLSTSVKLINSVNPDVVLFGGDLIDEYRTKGISDDNRAAIIDNLSKINSRLGKYAILGEHDSSQDEIKQILIDSGFEIIMGTNKQIYYDNESYFNLVGIDSSSLNISSSYEGITSDIYTIVLTHKPDIFDSLDLNRTDLVLAGHSHGPQVYIPLINNFYREEGYDKYAHGKHYKNGVTLDITNGVGLTKNSTRFNSDAEVVFYKLQGNN